MIPARLERSVLFVPASRWPMIEKAARSDADAICIDIEDAVSVDEKPAARANVVRAFRELDRLHTELEEWHMRAGAERQP